MGNVCRARDTWPGRDAAIKVMGGKLLSQCDRRYLQPGRCQCPPRAHAEWGGRGLAPTDATKEGCEAPNPGWQARQAGLLRGAGMETATVTVPEASGRAGVSPGRVGRAAAVDPLAARCV